MTKKLIKIAIITLISMVATACQKSTEVDEPIKLPEIIQAYDRTPFGRDHFHVYKRAITPLWEHVKADHPTIELLEYGVPHNITPDEVLKQFQQTLGKNWAIDPKLNQESDWGWSIGFRNHKHVFIFTTINNQLVNIPPSFPVIPAGIITNAAIKQQHTISIHSATNNSDI